MEKEAYERKKREHQEEEEEKARLIRLEEFKGQKCRGMKIRSGTSITQEKEEMRCSKRRKLKEPEQTQTEAINNILAIEHQALNILAIKYFPEPKTMTEATTQSSEQVPPSTPAETRIRSVKQKTKNNYITKLYGWSAWWSMVERQNRPDKSQAPVYQKLTSLEKSKFRFRNLEAERKIFIEKETEILRF